MPFAHVFGYFFLGIAAWEACGRLGVPWLVHALTQYGRPEQARRILERSIRRPSLLPAMYRSSEHQMLAGLYMAEGRYDDAAIHWRRANCLGIAVSEEEYIWQRLIECLVASENFTAAEEALQRFHERRPNAPLDSGFHVARAQLHAHEGRYAASARAYAAALRDDDMPPGYRASVVFGLAWSLYYSGQTRAAVERLEECLPSLTQAHERMQAHSMAGYGYLSLGAAVQAEEHLNAAIALALEQGEKDSAAGYTEQLAHVRSELGNIQHALETCRAAAELAESPQHAPHYVEALCYRLLGDFDAARQAHEQRRRAIADDTDKEYALDGALNDLANAWLEAEAGRPDTASRWLAEAEAELRDDERLGLGWEAEAAWIYALQGRADEARACAARAEEQLAETADPEICDSARMLLGIACRVLRDYERSEALLDRCLSGDLTPTLRAQALYHAGETRWARGDAPGARERFAECAALGIGTYHVRQAQVRLEELDRSA